MSPDGSNTEQAEILEQALQHCEREPIHQVGSVQPHGILLALDKTFVVRYCSENADSVFSRPWTEMLGKNFSGFVSESTVEQIQSLKGLGDWRSSAVLKLDIESGGRWITRDAAISFNAGYWLVELETMAPDQSELFGQMFVPTRDLLWQLDAEQELSNYTSKAAELVRLATGYDRVLMYQFDSNWDGEVIAESRSELTRSYLGNRFPASDIPAQARALYTRNLTRVIADVNAPSARVLSEQDNASATPLDLTYSAYRSLSPVHLEYLRNMGVTATLTISLIQNGKLWGMLACHHKSPKYVTLRERELYELIGKTISIKLSDLQRNEEKELKDRVNRFLLNIPSNSMGELSATAANELMSIVDATGVVLVSNGCRFTYGQTPSETELQELESELRLREPEHAFHTDELASLYPNAAHYADKACGILLAPLNHTLDNYLMWCRGHVTLTRHWAGKPHKELSRTEDGFRVSPRQSFDNWIQTYHHKSAPWTTLQTELAADLAYAFIKQVSQQSALEQEQNFRNLVELSTNMFIRLDQKAHIVYASSACEQVMGQNPASLEGVLFTDLLQNDDAAAFRKAWGSLGQTANANPQQLIMSFIHADGRCVWAEVEFRQPEGRDKATHGVILTMHDVTQRHNYQTALEDLHQRNALLLNAKEDGIFSVNEAGFINYANSRALRILGYQNENELIGENYEQLLQPADRNGAAYPENQSPLTRALHTGQEKEASTDQFRTKSGRLLPVGYKCIPLTLNDHLTGLLVVFRRQDQLTQPDRKVITSEAALNQTSEAVVITDPASRILSVNRSFCTITGYAAGEVIGRKPSFLKSGIHTSSFYQNLWQSLRNKGGWEGEIWNRRKTGEIVPFRGSITAVHDDTGNISNFIGVFSDYSKAKQAEENLLLARKYDSLTGLPNRQYCLEKIQQGIVSSSRDEYGLAVVLLDIDNFKLLNDTQGHDIGDHFLKTVADRLAEAQPENGLLCRWGSDEFLLLLDPVKDKDAIAMIMQDLFSRLSKPFLLPNHEVIPSVSAGISFYPEDAYDTKELILAAETALLRAKEGGPASINFFTPILADRIHRKFEIANELRRAVRENELQLYFQPQVSSHTQNLIGVEALVRWNHPRKGLVPPNEFIPMAEELNQIELVGDWVLNKALEQMAQWQKSRLEVPRIAVNIAPQQLVHGFVQRVGELLERHQVPAHALELEITEGALERGENIINLLNALREIGVQLSIDDFGTGYSSLAHLKHLPVNCFKIDKAFVDGLPEGVFDVAILRAVLALGHSLKIKVLAEGVENCAQFGFLREQGVDAIQGYLFGKPMHAEGLFDWINERKCFRSDTPRTSPE